MLATLCNCGIRFLIYILFAARNLVKVLFSFCSKSITFMPVMPGHTVPGLPNTGLPSTGLPKSVRQKLCFACESVPRTLQSVDKTKDKYLLIGKEPFV